MSDHRNGYSCEDIEDALTDAEDECKRLSRAGKTFLEIQRKEHAADLARARREALLAAAREADQMAESYMGGKSMPGHWDKSTSAANALWGLRSRLLDLAALAGTPDATKEETT